MLGYITWHNSLEVEHRILEPKPLQFLSLNLKFWPRRKIEEMQYSSYFSALLAATVATACTIPEDTLSNNITKPFGVLVQNPKYPVIHNKYMNLNAAGGGDRHLFLEPVPDPVRNLTLADGILEWTYGGIHAVINGEVGTLYPQLHKDISADRV